MVGSREMSKGSICRFLLFLAGSLLAISTPHEPAAGQYTPDERLRQSYTSGAPERPTNDWVLASGGRLYDNWWVALGRDPPDGAHPSYPKNTGIPDPQTWRCVQCHGWDYRGRDGAYATGSHRTGIKGVDRMAGVNPRKIAAIVRDKLHQFTPELIPNDALDKLARFISEGQHGIDRYFDRDTLKGRGNVERGRAIFQNACANCHEFDGRAQISGEEPGLATVGAVAARNPWQALHKIRNGQPGGDMPAMRVFDPQVVADVLTYMQTLPPR